MALVMHAGKANTNAYKGFIAAEYAGVEIKGVENFVMDVTNKTPEFLKMNPIGKVPVLETPDGVIFESNAIARYVARLNPATSLFGSSPIEYGHVEQWIDFSSLEIYSNLLTWGRQRVGYDNYHASVEEAAIANVKRALDVLNTYLATRTFLVGDDVTLADIIMTCNLYIGFKFITTKTFTSEFPHVERYFWTMINQPNFSKILGELKQVEEVPPLPPPKTYPNPEQKDKPEKVENNEAPPKHKEEETPKPRPQPKAKPKNPLDLLPPTNMILDDWKRLYSNTKTNFREVAIKVTEFAKLSNDPEGQVKAKAFLALDSKKRSFVSSFSLEETASSTATMSSTRKHSAKSTEPDYTEFRLDDVEDLISSRSGKKPAQSTPVSEAKAPSTRAKATSKRKRTTDLESSLNHAEKKLYDMIGQEFATAKNLFAQEMSASNKEILGLRSALAAKDKQLAKALKELQDSQVELMHTQAGITERVAEVTDKAKLWAGKAVLEARLRMVEEAEDPAFDRAKWTVAKWKESLVNFGGGEETQGEAEAEEVAADEAGTSRVQDKDEGVAVVAG